MGISQDLSGQITIAQKYADNALTNTQTFLVALQDLAKTVFTVATVDKFYPDHFGSLDSALAKIDTQKPKLSDKSFANFGDVVGLPKITDTKPIDAITVPSFNSNPPTPDYGTKPMAFTGNVPLNSHTFVSPTMPSKPDLNIPSMPALSAPGMPPPPVVSISTLEPFVAPVSILPPSNNFTFAEVLYISALKNAVTAKLLADIANGGYGIDPVDEQRLWDATRERELSSSKSMVEESKRQMASYGWSLPSGIMLRNIKEGNQKVISATSLINRDISIKRADLYKENRQFAISKSLELEQLTMNFHSSMMERTLNTAKFTLQAALDVYNAQTRNFELNLDVYKTKAVAYESQVRAELARVEIYKSQIDGVAASVNVQKLQIDGYTALVSAIQTKAQVYKTEMEATVVQGDIEKLYLEAYKLQIEAFAETVRAKQAEFDGYKTSMSGEVAKAEVFSASAKAYDSQVSGLRAKADIAKLIFEAQAEKARLDMEKFTKVDYEIWNSKFKAFVENIQKDAEKYKADIGLFTAVASSIGEIARVAVASTEGQANVNIKAASLNMEKAKIELEAMVASAQARQAAAQAGANVYGNMASAALSTVHAQLQESLSSSESFNHNYQE